jgi:hypothetical protein
MKPLRSTLGSRSRTSADGRDAVAAYENAIALDSANRDAHYNLAGIYERRRQGGRAPSS